jgi:formamidopyrimidine-DNA glycosylase
VPELPEVEYYRRLALETVGRPVARVEAPDAWILKGATSARSLKRVLTGRAFTGARRIGKLLLLDVDGGATLGLRFGMTGRLLVDGKAGVDSLLYSSDAPIEEWDRFRLRFADGGDLRLRDPRRLGGVELDPDEARLGPDAHGVALADVRRALRSRAPVKARIMDQAHLAGVGNLIADEVLWRAGLDPVRPAESLDANEVRRLHRHLTKTVEDVLERGGTHTVDLLPHRVPGGRCPRDGAELIRRTVGGRTTWSCPQHQR